MIKPTSDSGQAPKKDGSLGPFDFAAASSIGFAMAAQAVDMWFGVMSGMAKASQEMIEPQLKAKAGEPAPYAPTEKPFEVTAKSALRTVVADIERTSQDVAGVALKVLGGAAKNTKPEKRDTEVSAKAADIVAFEPKPEKAPAKSRHKPEARSDAAAPAVTTVNVAEPVVEAPAVAVAEATSRELAAVAVEAPAVPTVEAPAIVPAETPATAAKSERVARVSSSAPAAATAEPAAKTASFTIMPEDFRAPKAIDKPESPDDLKRVAGVGPKLETVLNGLGVWTFAQVAAWQAEEIAWVDDYLGLNGRIGRDDWTGQARSLSDGMKAAS